MMKADVEKLRRALDEGVILAVVQGQKMLAVRLKRFYEGLEVVIDGESISSDPLGTWCRRAMGLTNEVLEESRGYMKEGAEQEEVRWSHRGGRWREPRS